MKKNFNELRLYLFKVWSCKIFKLTNLLLFAAVFNVFGQRVITGTVTDGSRNSLPGVNVIVVGTTVGTMTDINGGYRLTVPAGGTTLQFSFIGMETQDVAIGNRTTVDVTMRDAAIGLEEVVVVGYGTKVRSTVTGAISQVGSSEITAYAPSTTLQNALQANVSGAFVVQTNGAPGENANIFLRGPVSVNGSNPLYIIDGVPMRNIDYRFNPDDIESVSVLKDASAAAIYGAQAAGGVILVTTKRGTNSPIRIRANASIGLRNALYIPDFLNRDQFLAAKEAYGTDVVDTYGPRDKFNTLPDTDWYGAMLRTGTEQNYGISMTGGNNISTFFLSGGFNRVDGIVILNRLERYTLRINTDHQLLKKLKFNQGLYFRYGRENPTRQGTRGMGETFRHQPVMAIYDPNATDNYGWAKVIKGFQGENRIQDLNSRKELNKDYNLMLNGNLSYDIIAGLKASVFGSMNMEFGENYAYVYPRNTGAFQDNGSISNSQNQRQDYIVTYRLDYNKKIGLHDISALAGYEARRRETANVSYGNSASLIEELWNSNLVVSATAASGSFAKSDVADRILSQFGRIDYTYADKYLFTGNIRRDGYGSKFAPKYKYGVFPGASLGWIISREDFFNIPGVDLLKLRGGYGILGNAVGSDFAFSSNYGVGYSQDWASTNTNSKVSGIALASRLANPEIRWESVATTNLGFDAVLWQGRLSIDLSYYSRQTKDMLYNISLPNSAGVGGSVSANIGQMSNKGFELSLDHKNNIGNFGYNVGINLANNKNKLITLNPEIDRLAVNSGSYGSGLYISGNPSRSEPGKPLGRFYGLKTNGIYQTDAEGAAGPTVNITTTPYVPKAGDLRYVDLNNDGRITTADYDYIGTPWPKLTYGLTLGGNWKRMIDVRAVFAGTYGNDLYNSYESIEHNFYSDYTSTMKVWECSFFGSTGLTNKPRNATLKIPDNNGNWRFPSDYHVRNGSYMQLKSLSVGFTVPKATAAKLNVNNARIVFSGDNLFILTKYDGLSPLVSGSIMSQGIDGSTIRYPFSRLFSLGLNIDF